MYLSLHYFDTCLGIRKSISPVNSSAVKFMKVLFWELAYAGITPEE